LAFHGATLQVMAGTTSGNGFIGGNVVAHVYSEGAVIDTNGQNIGITTPLLAPTDQGVTNIAVGAGGAVIPIRRW